MTQVLNPLARAVSEPLLLTERARVLVDILDRLGGDGTVAALNYDGDDSKIERELTAFVAYLEERAKTETLYALLVKFEAPKVVLDRFRDGEWTVAEMMAAVEAWR